MEKENLKIVIVGHVDHGKSTLIGRLLLDTHSLPLDKISEVKRIAKELGKDTELAFLTDQLKEEREQDKTIDTTQIFFKTRRRNYVIIDAPGHVEFIKNMLTGASQAEAAVLIVDIHLGMQEQTRRHAYLIGLLGINKVIVLLNKMDLINYAEAHFKRVKNELLKFLDNLGIKPVFIIPVSAKNGAGISKNSSQMPWYKGPCLLKALDAIESSIKGREKPLRFAVQDIYEIEGEKIIAGKVISGSIRQNQTVTVYPACLPCRIKALKVFGKDLKRASTGQNLGLILDNTSSVRRGAIIAAKEDLLQPQDNFKADVFWMARLPLRLKQPLTLRCSSQETACIAEKIERRINSSTLEILEEDAQELKENEAGCVIFRTEKPIILERFDFIEELGRFVLEEGFNPQGAGIIT